VSNYYQLLFVSPRFELPITKDDNIEKKVNITCHTCGQPGHKASSCPQNPQKENYKVLISFLLIFICFEIHYHTIYS